MFNVGGRAVIIISCEVWVLCSFVCFEFVEACRTNWTEWKYSKVENGILIRRAHSVEQCQKACVKNDSCTGFTHMHHFFMMAYQRCWMAGPWSGDIKKGTAGRAYSHYALTRICGPTAEGKESQENVLVQ